MCRYVTALGMFYLRMTGTSKEIYTELEPFYSDYRKLRLLSPEGWKIIHMDEYVDMLINDEMILNIALPHLDKRFVLEKRGVLPPRRSVLEEEFEELLKETDKEEERKSHKRHHRSEDVEKRKNM